MDTARIIQTGEIISSIDLSLISFNAKIED